MLANLFAFFNKYNLTFLFVITYGFWWASEIHGKYESDVKIYKWHRVFISFCKLPYNIYRLIKRNIFFFRNRAPNIINRLILIAIILDYKIVLAFLIIILLFYFLTFVLFLLNLFIDKSKLTGIIEYFVKLCWSTPDVWYSEIKSNIKKKRKPVMDRIEKIKIYIIISTFMKGFFNIENWKEDCLDFLKGIRLNLRRKRKKYYKRLIKNSQEKAKIYSNKPFKYWFNLELKILYYRIKSLFLKIMKIIHSFFFKITVSKLYDVYIWYNDNIYLEWYYFRKERGIFFEFSIEYFKAYFGYLREEFVEYIKDTLIIIKIDIKRYLWGMLERWLIISIYCLKIWIALYGVGLFLDYLVSISIQVA